MNFPFVDSDTKGTAVRVDKPRFAKRDWELELRDGRCSVSAHWMRVQEGMICFFNDHPDPNQNDILALAYNVDDVITFCEVLD